MIANSQVYTFINTLAAITSSSSEQNHIQSFHAIQSGYLYALGRNDLLQDDKPKNSFSANPLTEKVFQFYKNMPKLTFLWLFVFKHF